MYNFFFNDTATTEIYTLSLHDALPICINTATAFAYQDVVKSAQELLALAGAGTLDRAAVEQHVLLLTTPQLIRRSEEHTSELQSRLHLVCRLLLEKKKKFMTNIHHTNR